MTTDPSLIAHTPDEVLCAVPYLLGFYPEQSIVLVALRRRRVVFTARIDLPDAICHAARLHDVVCRNGGDTVILIGYAAHPSTVGPVLGEVVDRFADVDVADALISDGGRWWSLLCNDEHCCPADGTPYDVTSSRFAAEAVARGLPALRSRSELIAQVQGPDATRLAGVRAAFEGVLPDVSGWDLAERHRWVVDLLDRFEVRRGLRDADCATLAVLCHDPEVREEVLLGIHRHDAERQVALWSTVVARSAAPFEVAPLCLLALAAWLSGNGALQVVAMERAEQLNPGFSMLNLLNDIHDQALAPSRWDSVAA